MSLRPRPGRGQPTVPRRVGALLAGAVAASLLTAVPARADEPEPPVPMVSIVSGADSQYGLTADHSAVYQRSSASPDWSRIGGPASHLYTSGNTLYATNPRSGDIHQYNRARGTWTRIGGPGADFAGTRDRLYGASPDHSGVYAYTGTPGSWFRIGGPLAP
ncbi:hypothetical protein ACWY4P_00750 [Streptomyces sp. LZ34]